MNDIDRHNARIIGTQRGCFHMKGLRVYLYSKEVVCLDCGFKWVPTDD